MWASEGLPIDQFWSITPLQFTNIMRGRNWAREERQQEAVTNAWYGEAFHRTKRLPKLETLLNPQDGIEDQEPDDIMAVLMAIEAGGGNNMTIKEVEAPWLLQ